jgi:hypothetical protein
LKARLDALAASFASEVVRALQSASLDELVDGIKGNGGRPHRGDQREKAQNVASRPGRPPFARLPRRSADDITAALNKVHALLKDTPQGLRSEDIRHALKLDVRELPRVLQAGLASKTLTSKGRKRATTYFARG